jgi:putative sterol carrier protein
VVRYLSLAWLEALTEAVADCSADAGVPTDQPIGVTQVVTKGPEGTIVYHLRVDGDGVRFGPGPADPEDVRFEQKWKTAVGVATGKLAAPEAFLKGLIRLSGDRDKLIAAQPVMAALEPIFATVREQTEYA